MGVKAHYVKSSPKTAIDSTFDEELKNLLNEQYNPEKPNAIWCSQISPTFTLSKREKPRCAQPIIRAARVWLFSSQKSVPLF
jgi:hypothetical protein